MTEFEFDATLEADGTINVPAEISSQLKGITSVHVVIIALDDEDDAWERLGAEQFFKGYADSDSIYDDP